MKQRIVIYAENGKVLTNGETYGQIVYLGEQDKIENYYEITKEEYQQILANKTSEKIIEEE